MNAIALVAHLKDGRTVREASVLLGKSYQTTCRHLREIGFDRTGSPVPRAARTSRMLSMYEALSTLPTLAEAAAAIRCDKQHVTQMFSRLGIRPKWSLENHEHQTTSAARTAELFVAKMRPKWLVRDCYSCETGHGQFPYDLILRGQADLVFADGTIFTGGSVDVKHAGLKTDQADARHKSPRNRWLFSVENFGRKVKWCALVGFNADKTEILRVWLLPGHLVHGHSTIRVAHPQSAHDRYLVWRAPDPT